MFKIARNAVPKPPNKVKSKLKGLWIEHERLVKYSTYLILEK